MNIHLKLRYAMAKLEEYQKAEAYRFYCTTALKCIAENSRAICGGSAPEKSFWEILNGADTQKKKEMSQEEIIESVTKNAGLLVMDDEP